MAKKVKQDALDKMLDDLEGGHTEAEPVNDEVLAESTPNAQVVPDDSDTAVDDLASILAAEPPTLGELQSGSQPGNQPATDLQVVRKTTQIIDGDPAGAIMAMLTQIKDEFETISADVLGQWRADRNQLQTVIVTLINAMGQDPNTAARPVVEGLVKLLDTKVNSGMLAVKLLEVKTKLLVALKNSGSIVINQNIGGNQNAELTEMLSRPEESDLD